ncbi:MAG: hypothetical protein K5683_06535 [Prevotella sp.]|nr:hypothetical protein [Prevotella sp.]
MNKKSGKVVVSRYEIRERFDHLDWKDQKKIISAFLESGKTDRQWAYLQALSYWDKSFEPKVKELWEQYGEETCSRVVACRFPVEYVLKNIDRLTRSRDYFFACLRLAEDKDFVIDRQRLSLTDYLAVLYHTGRHLSEVEARDVPYLAVHQVCTNLGSEREVLDRFTFVTRDVIVSPIHLRLVSLALYYLQKLECNLVIRQFKDWNDAVQEAIFNSKEYKYLLKVGFDAAPFNRTGIARKYGYLALDSKYRQPSDPDVSTILLPNEDYITSSDNSLEHDDAAVVEDMRGRNPAIGKLIDGFALEADTLH